MRSVAASVGARLVLLEGAQVFSSLSGETESRIRSAFEEAQSSIGPTILFIDELVWPVGPVYLLCSSALCRLWLWAWQIRAYGAGSCC